MAKYEVRVGNPGGNSETVIVESNDRSRAAAAGLAMVKAKWEAQGKYTDDLQVQYCSNKP